VHRGRLSSPTRRSSDLGWRPWLCHYAGLSHQLLQAAQRIGPVFLLGAKLLSLDHDDAIPADAAVVQIQQAVLVEVGQRRGVDVEAQMNRRRHLVDVLTTRTLGADRSELDLLVGDADVDGYWQHGLNGRCFLWSVGYRGLIGEKYESLEML